MMMMNILEIALKRLRKVRNSEYGTFEFPMTKYVTYLV